MKRITALILAFALVMPLFPVVGLAAEGDSHKNNITIAPGLNYQTSTTDNSDTVRTQSFELDHTPNTTVVPHVVYGDKLFGMSNINTVVQYWKNQGHNVVAAVNSDFFETDSGIPTGIVIRDGGLVSSDGHWNGIAFSADGKAHVGTPGLSMKMTRGTDGAVYPVYAFNKDRTGSGIHLFSGAYAADTKTSAGGTMVVLEKADNAPLKIGQPATFKVVSVEWLKGSKNLSSTQYALTYNDKYTGTTDLATLAEGDQLTLDISVADTAFQNALYATGGGDILAKGGVLTDKVKTDKAPRTVLGAKADGSFKVMAVDGRQSLVSGGISIKDAAQTLVAEGFTEVINLDGGGSTAMAVTLPGDTNSYVVNSPSDSVLRKCATYILFVNQSARQAATQGQVYPINPVVLAGSTKAVYTLAYDDNYHGYGEVQSSAVASAGTIDGGKFTSPKVDGVVQITATSGNLKIKPTEFTVITSPDKLFLLKGGKTLTELTVSPGDKVSFEALAYFKSRKVTALNSDFQWSVSSSVGSIDKDGVFTAAEMSGGKGSITLRAGQTTATVTVQVGVEPYEIAGFEEQREVSVESVPQGKATGAISSNGGDVRYGKNALQLSYDGAETATAYLNLPISSGSKSISMWLLNQGTGKYSADIRLTDGSIVTIPISAGKDQWEQIGIDLPAKAESLKSITITGGSGTLSIDGIWGHFDNMMSDSVPPIVQLISGEGGKYKVSVFENSPIEIPAYNISVKIDGQALAFEYNAAQGEITFEYADAIQPHKLNITVKDFFGNITRMPINLEPESYTTGFADMEGHWAIGYVETLTNRGVFSKADKFLPYNDANCQMVATMVSRYLNIDTSLYQNVELPFADNGEIDDWALPHIKALYSMGIMNGSLNNGVKTFTPKAPITRAQVMAILGRTLDRGYQLAPLGFDDVKDIPEWAENEVQLLTSLGVVNGYGGTNTVKPGANIQRGEIAALLYKLY